MSRIRKTQQWAMFLHFSVLASWVAPFAGLIVPIVIWQVKKKELPELDIHGKIVTNWIISQLIYIAISTILIFFLIGIPLLFAIFVASIIFPIIAGIKANNGKIWKYPLSIQFLK
ncbi:MAG: DUF4870 domain-containing protein [Microcoleaceae cyanobacterium]